MKKLTRQQLILGGLFAALLVLLVPVSLWAASADPNGTESDNKIKIEFSQKSGFYDQNVNLRLEASGGGEIYYTLDGSKPSRENSAAQNYQPGTEIRLVCGNKEKVYNVRAACIDEDGAVSQVFTETYIIGRKVKERYDVPVLAISGDPAQLLDEQTGILAMENRNLRGPESERDINITLFDSDGGVMLNQNCGVRVFGSATRGKNQPSLKLYARSEYDEENRFDCVLFEDYSVDNALITDCKRVIVRNGGDDNGYAHLRSEFASRLCLDAGFPDAQASSPVCLYINREYYGAYWLVSVYDASYFEKKYGEYDGEMVVLENNIAYAQPLETDDEITLEIKEEYNNLYQMLSEMDLSVDANWKVLNDTIDVENFLQYIALENYFCNTDSMVNNFKAYRYYAPDGNYQTGTVFDGRYRFLIHDLDQTLGYGVYDTPDAEAQILSTANRVGYDIFYNALFSNIVGTREGREYYTRYYLSLLNYYCEPERARAILDEMHSSRAAELRTQYSETNFMENNMETPEGIDYSHVIRSLDLIRKFLEDRPGWALTDLEEAFGLAGRYTLSLQNPGEAYISVDFAKFYDKAYEGTYFSEIPVVLTAQPKCGDQFDYWLVDGVEYYNPTLTITGEMLKDETVFVECITSRDPGAGLVISAIKSRGGNDYVEMTNFGTEEIDLSLYKLGDDPDRENASTLPSLIIRPGASVIAYCKSYTGAEAIGQPEVNFNIKAGETVYLYKDKLLQQVYVPKLGTRNGVYRLDTFSGEFYECLE